jgi:RNA polymerase sigma-70 factor (subfamily 1)
MSGPSEQSLIERARAGDGAAFEALCARHETALQKKILKRLSAGLRRKVSVLDVLQEVYLEAHRGLPTFEPRGPGAFGVWLKKIAEFKAREAARRFSGAQKRDARREVSRGARADTGAHPAPDPSPSEVAMGEEKRDEILGAMSDLSPDYRRVIELVQLGRLPIGTVAEMMGRTPQATRRLYSRALGRLADLLHYHRGESSDGR